MHTSETQLRSRLKKWGVTKPSRQRRKKPCGARIQSPSVSGTERAELITSNEGNRVVAPQLSAITMQPISCPDHTNWNDSRGWLALPGRSQAHPLKNSAFLEGQKMESTWVPSSSQVHDDPGGNHQHYMFAQFPPIPVPQ